MDTRLVTATTWMGNFFLEFLKQKFSELFRVFSYLMSENVTVPFRPSPTRKLVIVISSVGWNKGNFINGEELGYPNPNDHIATLKTV